MNGLRRWLARGKLGSLRFYLACRWWRREYDKEEAANEADGDFGDCWWGE